MICKLFYCEARRSSYCCAKCEYKSNCDNACLNSPSKCGSAVKPVNDTKFMKYLISGNENSVRRLVEYCDTLDEISEEVSELCSIADELSDIAMEIKLRNVEFMDYSGVRKCFY